MGLSMGGMIVQTMAIEHPDRLLSMTSVMSRTGEPDYGAVDAGGVRVADRHRRPTDRESSVADHIAGLRVWGSPAFADEASVARATPSAPSTVASIHQAQAASSALSVRRPAGPIDCAR